MKLNHNPTHMTPKELRNLKRLIQSCNKHNMDLALTIAKQHEIDLKLHYATMERWLNKRVKLKSKSEGINLFWKITYLKCCDINFAIIGFKMSSL